eukprot:6188753-Pyramimonas_sp.AAC.1
MSTCKNPGCFLAVPSIGWQRGRAKGERQRARARGKEGGNDRNGRQIRATGPNGGSNAKAREARYTVPEQTQAGKGAEHSKERRRRPSESPERSQTPPEGQMKTPKRPPRGHSNEKALIFCTSSVELKVLSSTVFQAAEQKPKRPP